MKMFNQLSGKKNSTTRKLCQVELKKKGWQQSTIFLSTEEGFYTDANCSARKGLLQVRGTSILI